MEKEIDLEFKSTDKERLEKYKTSNVTFRDLYNKIKEILNANSSTYDWKQLQADANWVYLKWANQILPYCCGITEFGNFVFGMDSLSKETREVVYKLLIDTMRLYANSNRNIETGSYSIINYFVETEFNKILHQRDDITFIKNFKNPKTSAVLDTFIFDNAI